VVKPVTLPAASAMGPMRASRAAHRPLRAPSAHKLLSPPGAKRASQRGAAVFVVVLVITLLSALGLFALRSATLTNLSAGYSRQMTQTHYMTEYSLTLMAGELGGPARQNYADEMWSGRHSGECTGGASLNNSTCFPVYYPDLENRIKSYNSANRLLVPTTGTTYNPTPGSLGPSPLEGDLRIELADLHEAMPPIEGMDLTGHSASPRYFSVTVSATGQVRPQTADPTQCTAAAWAAAGLESSRAHLVFGPLSH
jgi:hypothetical protein